MAFWNKKPGDRWKKITDFIRGKYDTQTGDDVETILQEYQQQKSEQEKQNEKEQQEEQDQQEEQQAGQEQSSKSKQKSSAEQQQSGQGQMQPQQSVQEMMEKIFGKGGKKTPGGEPQPLDETERYNEEDMNEFSGSMPEWDFRKQAYFPRANLNKRYVQEANPERYQIFQNKYGYLVDMVIGELQKLEKTKSQKVIGKRGTRMNAKRAIAEVTRVKSGKEPKGDVYEKKMRSEREYTVGILLDQSNSTRHYVTETETRIDIETYTALILAEALDYLGDEFSVAGFDSSDYHTVNVSYTKRYADPWNDSARYATCNLRPRDETRLGGAIRAMTQDIVKQKERNKILFIITDGLPYQGDGVYDDANYALQDTSKAMEEAEGKGVRVVYLNIDPQINYFKVLSEKPSFAKSYKEITELPMEIMNIYKKLTKL